jgi:UV DNA damage endonuclease
MRFGLCCLFTQEKIGFRTTTAKALLAMPRGSGLAKLSEICLHNANSLLAAVRAVHRLGIGAYRIPSQLFPRTTHPVVGYGLDDLQDAAAIRKLLASTRSFAHGHGIRLSFHPDQFVMLSSPNQSVTAGSIRELESQSIWARDVGADVINIHGGGAYGDKAQALERFRGVFRDLPDGVSCRLTLENDDVSYTVRDLLPLCEELSIPLVYDVHHHRCNPDGLTVEEATALAGETWRALGREQYCHVSSPRNGWGGGDPRPHAEFVDPADLPRFWLDRAMTVDVEAKAKELAVLRLMGALAAEGRL